MAAMTSLDLMAGQAGVRPALTGRPAGVRVLVLGVGVSGLVVGYELGKLGYDFRILEARDRVGGLAWTVRRGTEHTETNGERPLRGRSCVATHIDAKAMEPAAGSSLGRGNTSRRGRQGRRTCLPSTSGILKYRLLS